MELIQGTRKAPKFAPQDFISNMPDNVVTNILDRLPLQDAVRTSIQSRSWRFKWMMLSQLVFDTNFWYLLERKGEYSYGRIISTLLLHTKGAITKFVLYIEENGILNDEDINHWLLFLSGKGVKDITLRNMATRFLKFPTHLFSCLELTHLKLDSYHFNPPTTFHGFPNLLSLELCQVEIGTRKFEEIFTWCPVLENLNLGLTICFGKLKLHEIAKLSNLKILSLALYNLDNTCSSTIFELVGFLPKLQELNLDFVCCKLTKGDAKKRSSTTFPCLKALKLTTIDLGNGSMLSCAFELIRCFSNLQTLEITTFECVGIPTHAICSPKVDYDPTRLLQLRSVMIEDFKGSDNEVWLVSYLLACSPFLKRIVIHPLLCLSAGKMLMLARRLLKLNRASPIAKVDLY